MSFGGWRGRKDVLSLTPLSPPCVATSLSMARCWICFLTNPPCGSQRGRCLGPAQLRRSARVLGARSAEDYRRFRRHAAAIYRAVEGPFLRRPLPQGPMDILSKFNSGDSLACATSMPRAACGGP